MSLSALPGFQVLASPAYKAVIFNHTGTHELGNLCRRMNSMIEEMGYHVEDWHANPFYIVKPGGWVQPMDQESIKDWLGLQFSCKYMFTERDKNDRKQTMVLWLVDEARNPIDLDRIQIL